MTVIEERELLNRFKLSLAEKQISNLIKVLSDEEIQVLTDTIKELGYDTEIITKEIHKKDPVLVLKAPTNSLEEYYNNMKRRNN